MGELLLGIRKAQALPGGSPWRVSSMVELGLLKYPRLGDK